MKPDFLYIGAPRAGSTWLFRNLEQHPDIWLPPCKNILYFHPRFQIYRFKFLKYFGKGLFSKDVQEAEWYRKFFLTPFVSDSWYTQLFPDNKTIKGEIAEAYCSLEKKDVLRIKDLNPDLKIIFTMRNPYERAISHAKLGVLKRKNKKITDITAQELLDHINHPSSEARSTYSKTIDLWSKHFPQEQILVNFYEEVQNTPSDYLQNICRFLGVSDDISIFKFTQKDKVNTTEQEAIPEEVRLHTALKYQDEINTLAERYKGPALEWKKEIERILK